MNERTGEEKKTERWRLFECIKRNYLIEFMYDAVPCVSVTASTSVSLFYSFSQLKRMDE